MMEINKCIRRRLLYSSMKVMVLETKKNLVMDYQARRSNNSMQTSEYCEKISFKIKTQNGNFLKKGSLNDFSKQHARFQSIFTYQKVPPDIQIITLPKKGPQDYRARLLCCSG